MLWISRWGSLFLSCKNHKGCGQKRWLFHEVSLQCYRFAHSVFSISGSTPEQGNSPWHIHTQKFPLTRAPKIWFTDQNACIPPLMPSHVHENCKHPPASSPIHHTLTWSYGLRNHLPAAWLTKSKFHQTIYSPAPTWALQHWQGWRNRVFCQGAEEIKVREQLGWDREKSSRAGELEFSHFIIVHE